MDKAPLTDADMNPEDRHVMRFHLPYSHLISLFGNDWFALRAEAFARFFGTPIFLAVQTAIVAAWIVLNVSGLIRFDAYPFILLNLAFSLQAAYAAPLILLAQTRQADRDKANAIADARHREDLAVANDQRLLEAAEQRRALIAMVEQNTDLTEMVRVLTEQVATLTREVHQQIVNQAAERGGSPAATE